MVSERWLDALIDVLKNLFKQRFGVAVERVQPLQGELGASGRKIVRLSGGASSAIGILYNVREENAAFIEFSRHFRAHGLPVPEIYGEDLSQGAYLEEDFGDTTLFEFLSANRAGNSISPTVVEAYRKVVALLPRFQIEAGRDINYKACYPRAEFDEQSIAWDLNYFKYYFLKLAGVPFNEQLLEDDFKRLTAFLLSARSDFFLYRDFQSRNIMLREGQPFFLDYQGGRKGALQYDIASLLFDAKADLPPALRQELLDLYIECAGDFVALERSAFMHHYYAYVYIRVMQAMGAYGFRGFYERKSHFLQSVPYALKNVEWLLQNVELPIALPALMDSLGRMRDSETLRELSSGGGPPPEYGCVIWIAGRCLQGKRSNRTYLQLFISTRHPQGRERPRRRVCFRRSQHPESRTRRKVQGSHWERCASDRVSESAGERTSISRQRHVAR